MSELTPITRVESYLDAIINSGIPPTEDITRIETFLQAIYDNTVCQLTPITRIEMFLCKISGQDIVLPVPITRVELYLAAIAGEDVELPENPITRLEMYLAEWADSGDWTTISGAIVEFIATRAHKLKSCVVSLSPKQDLHGQDAPYPAGGGKNKFNIFAIETVADSGGTGSLLTQNNDGTITVKTGTQANVRAEKTLSQLANLVVGETYILTANSTGTTKYIYLHKSAITWTFGSSKTITQDDLDGYISFYASGDGGTIAVISDMMIRLASVTDATFAPYENSCPISGWTGVSVYDTGHNAWDEVWENGYIDASGNNAPSSAIIRSKNYIPVKGGQSYCFHITDTASMWMSITQYDADKNFISQVSVLTNYVLQLDANTKFVRFYASSGYGNTYNNDISINYPSTDTDYHAYNGQSISATWEGEVFGGTPDVVSGEMPVTMGMVDLGTLNWSRIALPAPAPSGVYAFLASSFRMKSNSTRAICSNYHYVGSYIPVGNADKTCGFIYAENFVVRDDSYSDAASFKTAMSGVQLAYELATPTETTITPTPITTLKGYNAVWSDAGDIEVTVHGTPVEVSTLQALNMLLGGAYHNEQTAEDVSDDEALDIILGGEQR